MVRVPSICKTKSYKYWCRQNNNKWEWWKCRGAQVWRHFFFKAITHVAKIWKQMTKHIHTKLNWICHTSANEQWLIYGFMLVAMEMKNSRQLHCCDMERKGPNWAELIEKRKQLFKFIIFSRGFYGMEMTFYSSSFSLRLFSGCIAFVMAHTRQVPCVDYHAQQSASYW